MKRLGFVASLLLLMPVVFAEQLPPLDEALARALARSPEIAMAQARVSFAETQTRAARWGWFHPEARIYGGENAVNSAGRAGIQVSQDVMRLLTLNRDEVRKTEHDLTLARQALALANDTLIRQVSDTRFRLQRLEQAARLHAQLVAHHESLSLLATTQFEQGDLPLAQSLAAQDALLQAQQALSQTQAELHGVRIAWAQLLGEPLPVDP